jgi:hypothetical protein
MEGNFKILGALNERHAARVRKDAHDSDTGAPVMTPERLRRAFGERGVGVRAVLIS